MPLRLLVVDDESGVRALAKGAFAQDSGIEVLPASNGAEAIELLLQQPVDLVLLDLTMPVMGGLEALKAIRAISTIAHLPVLILTGRADEERIKAAIQMGIVGCLTKPFAVRDLRIRVTEFFTSLRRPDGSVRRESTFVSLARQDRVLLIDRGDDFRMLAEQVLGRVCNVESEENEFSGLVRATHTTFAAVVLGLLTDWSDPPAIARRFRQLPSSQDMTLIAVVPRQDVPTIEAADCFDAVVPRRLDAGEFEQAIGRALDEAGRGRLLFHPDSAWLAASFQALEPVFAEAFGASDIRSEAGSLVQPVPRTVVVHTECSGPHVDRIVSVRCPIAAALALAARERKTSPDEVSDDQARDSIEALARRLTMTLVERFTAVGLECECGASDATIQGSSGSYASPEVPRGAMYRFVSGSVELGLVELTTWKLLMRQGS